MVFDETKKSFPHSNNLVTNILVKDSSGLICEGRSDTMIMPFENHDIHRGHASIICWGLVGNHSQTFRTDKESSGCK